MCWKIRYGHEENTYFRTCNAQYNIAKIIGAHLNHQYEVAFLKDSNLNRKWDILSMVMTKALYYHDLNLIPARISNHMFRKVCDRINVAPLGNLGMDK